MFHQYTNLLNLQRYMLVFCGCFIFLALAKLSLFEMINQMHELGFAGDWKHVFTQKWDSKLFRNIFENGYANFAMGDPKTIDAHALYAFAPLFPYTVRLVDWFVQDWVYSSLIVSNLFYFLSVFAFYKVATLYTDQKQSVLLALAFGMFPIYLVYGTIAYSESIYLFFAISSFYFLKKRIFWMAAILVTFAIFSRYVGGFLLPLYVVIATVWLWQEKRKIIEWRLLWLIIPTLGYLILFYIFYIKTGEFFIVSTSHVHFGDSIKGPLEQVNFYFEGHFTKKHNINPIEMLVERYMFVIPFLALVLLNFRKHFELGIYGLVFIALAMSVVGISSIAVPRVMLASWVAILALNHQLKTSGYFVLYIGFLMAAFWVMHRFHSTFFA